jgi:hypothetical protein
MNIPIRPAVCTAAFVALVTPCAVAVAQHADDRWWFHLSGFRPSIDSTARSDFLRLDRPGTTVRFEDELGLADRATLPWFQVGARMGERWRFELEYLSLRREGTRDISREIVWGDSVFPVSATLGSEFDSDIVRLSVGYSFHRTAATELGAVFGLHATRFRLALATRVTAGSLVETGQADAEEAMVPLPTIGLFGTHDFLGKWSIAGRIDYFSLGVGDYEGGLVNGRVAIGYRVTDRFGVSAGFQYVDYSLEVSKSNWRGGVDYHFSGPYLSLQLGF